MSDAPTGGDDTNGTENEERDDAVGRRDYLLAGGVGIGASLFGLTHGVPPTTASASATSVANRSDDYYDLSDAVPDRAWNIWQNSPDDIREDVDAPVVSAADYDGRSGDLAELIEAASNDGEIVDLGSGTYEMRSSVSNTGTMLAIAGDGATVHIVGSQSNYASAVAFPLGGPSDDRILLQNVTFDISEGPDVAFLTTYGAVQEEIFLEDISFTGARERATENGFRNTLVVDCADGAEGFVHRCAFPDGGTEVDDEDDHYAIGFSIEDDHEGYNVWKDCYAANFEDNGFYLFSDGSGDNVVWNCHGRNNARGNIRIGDGDVVVGGTAEVTNERSEQEGTPFVHQEGEAEVIGLEIIAEGNSWGADAIQLRTDQEHCHFEKVVLHVRSGDSRPVRVDSTVNGAGSATFRDCYIYDEGENNNTFVVPRSNDGYLYLEEDVRVASDRGNEFNIGTSGELHYEGSTYTGTTLSADDLGLESPLDENGNLPEFYFGYENGGGEPGDGVLDLGDDDAADGSENENGVHFEAEQPLDAIRLTISQNSAGFTTCRLRDATSGDVVGERDVSNLDARDSFTVRPADGLEADTYYVTLDADGDEWTRGRLEAPDYPYANDELTVDSGVYTSGGSTTQSVRYSFTQIAADDALVLGDDDAADGSENENGVHFEAEQPLDAIRLTISQNSAGFTTCRLRDATSGAVIEERDVSNLEGGDSFTMAPADGLEADTYYVTLNADGDEWTRGRFEAPDYPYASDELTVDSGIYTSGGSATQSVRYSFTEIAPIYDA